MNHLDMPYFSVVIPTYNRADLLPRCIESVLNQSFLDYEIVIVDNYSEDGTVELVEKYINKGANITFIQEHNNGIIAHSRNVGIKAAKGQYIAFLDSDDWFATNKLQKVFELCEKSKPDLIYSRYRIMSSNGEGRVCGRELVWDDKFYELLITGSVICNATVVAKKEVIVSVSYLSEDPKLRAVEDIDLWLRLAKKGCSFVFINDSLCYYWVGDNLSNSTKQVEQIRNLYEKHIPAISQKKLKECLACRDYTTGRIYHKIGIFSEAKNDYIKAFPYLSIKRKLVTILLLLSTIVRKKM